MFCKSHKQVIAVFKRQLNVHPHFLNDILDWITWKKRVGFAPKCLIIWSFKTKFEFHNHMKKHQTMEKSIKKN